MIDFNRRDFLRTGGALALTGIFGRPEIALAGKGKAPSDTSHPERETVHFKGDGLNLTPLEYTTLLTQLAESEGFERDVYGNGGILEKLEQKFARLLGKETAVFLPTGTMANHIALRRLTGSLKRAIVQSDSHIYNDAGDGAQKLSGLNLLPIEGEFSAESITRTLEHSASGRVKTGVGAISLESPLRRGFNTTHSLAEVAGIAELARQQGIGLHLDGARMFMQAAHQGFAPAELAAFFDTVYVSLYKNFNSAGGAVLAGSKELLADLLHERRMFGGSPYQVWPLAAVALLFVDDFSEEYGRAKEVAFQLMDHLEDDSRFDFELIPGGSNQFWLRLTGVDPLQFVQKLAARHIQLIEPRPQWDGLLMMINPTLDLMDAPELAEAFRAAAEA